MHSLARGAPVAGRQIIFLTTVSILVALLASTAPAAARSSMALGVTPSGSGDTSTTLADFTASVGGNPPALWTLSSKWGSDVTRRFPTAAAEALQAKGVTPLIWWTPTSPTNWEAGRYERYERILMHKHDRYIRRWASDAKAFGHTVIVRFAHEANGTWFPWCVGCFDNTVSNFTQAWRYVRRIFREEGATNVKFLWSVAKQRCHGCNPYKKFYPGDAHVDYVGFTAFNWGDWNGHRWVSMVKSYTEPMVSIRAFTKKPIIVAETASHFKGGSKAGWIRAGYQNVYDKWPIIKAIVYLDSNPSNDWFRHPDWRLIKPKDGSALAAYSAVAAKPEFQGSLP